MKNLGILLLFGSFVIFCEVYGGNLNRGNRERAGRQKRSECPYLRKETGSKLHRNRRTTCAYTPITNCDASEPYRRADGSCNNLANTLWGRAETPDVRFLPSNYQDGTSVPKTRTHTDSADLPIARVVSTKILQDDDFANFTNGRLTHMIMQWGQFLDHDMTRTPTMETDSGTEPICCVDDLSDGSTTTQAELDSREECFAMPLTNRDRHFTRTCMNFVRSIQTTPLDCTDGPAEQLNLITHFIDASQVYSSSDTDMNNLRHSTSPGYLKTSEHELLPHRDSGAHCVVDSENPFCFLAGDERVNVHSGLMALQTLFMREHNRIAKIFYDNASGWSDDKIFFETRKILGALMQHITYNEYLPVIMGNEYANYNLQPTASGFNDVYNSSIDPSIRTEFATAAYRFGHSQIQSTMTRSFGNFSTATNLRDMFGRTSYITESDGEGLERIINGLLIDSPEKADRWYSLEITDWLFAKSDNDALDLGALNVQRGRDHGLPTYNDFREFCGFTKATTFDHEVQGGLFDHAEIPALRLMNTYAHPDDIDLYPGGISEKPVIGGALGPTFVCVLGHQFEKLRMGDRFWYETSNQDIGFTLDQLDSIKGMTLSRVICDNTKIGSIVKFAFEQPTQSKRNEVLDCDVIPGLDLSLWYS